MTVDIKSLSNEDQKEYLKEWFFSRYADPVHLCSYESAEGGYIYVWGGPFDTTEILQGYFDLDDEILEEIVDELERECSEWARIPTEEDFDFPVNSEFFEAFSQSINNTQKLLKLEIDEASENHFCQLLYASVVIALESFLSDAFISTLLSSNKYQQKLLETDPEFKKKTLTMDNFFKRQRDIKKYIENYLKSEIMWHNLRKVSKMYQSVFDISFTDSDATTKKIYQAIKIRHDIVHRNGKTNDGDYHEFNQGSVTSLIEEVNSLAQWIEEQLSELFSDDEGEDFVDPEEDLRKAIIKDIEEEYLSD